MIHDAQAFQNQINKYKKFVPRNSVEQSKPKIKNPDYDDYESVASETKDEVNFKFNI